MGRGLAGSLACAMCVGAAGDTVEPMEAAAATGEHEHSYAVLLCRTIVEAPRELWDQELTSDVFRRWAQPIAEAARRDGLTCEFAGYVRDSAPHWVGAVLLCAPDGASYEHPTILPPGGADDERLLRARLAAAESDYGDVLRSARAAATASPAAYPKRDRACPRDRDCC